MIWVVVLAAQASSGELNPYLSQAKVFHQGLEYEKCLQRLDQAERWNNAPAQLAEIELYRGVCKFELSAPVSEVKEHFRLALSLDIKVQPPAMMSDRLAALFGDEVARVRPQREAALADRPPLGLSSSAPPGRSFLGPGLTMGGGALIAGAGLVLAILTTLTSADARASVDPIGKPILVERAKGESLSALTLLGTGGAVFVAGLIWRLVLGGSDSPQAVFAPGAPGIAWSR
jgi:hypothetical protein